jgi:hypothetical protein
VKEFLLNAVGGWIERRPPPPLPEDIDPAEFRRLVKTNRLGPLMDACLPDVPTAPWREIRDEFRQAHRLCLAQTMRYESAAAAIIAQLACADIPCIGLRGPFADSELYGNEGRRAFTDLDLLIPASHRTGSLRLLQTLGYDFLPESLPEWFYRRHHLHWPLLNRESRIACDAHWAVDHPYSLLKIDYAAIFSRSTVAPDDRRAWRRLSPMDAVLMQAAHLAKECASRAASDAASDFTAEVLEAGLLLKWLDLALMLRTYRAVLEWDDVHATCIRWNLNDRLQAALSGCSALFPATAAWLPAGERQGGRGGACWGERPPVGQSSALRVHEAEIHATGLLHAPGTPHPPENAQAAKRPLTGILVLSQRGGFHATRLADALRYLWPPASYFPQMRGVMLCVGRVRHGATAALKLLQAAADGIACLLIVALRRSSRQRSHTPPHRTK